MRRRSRPVALLEGWRSSEAPISLAAGIGSGGHAPSCASRSCRLVHITRLDEVGTMIDFKSSPNETQAVTCM